MLRRGADLLPQPPKPPDPDLPGIAARAGTVVTLPEVPMPRRPSARIRTVLLRCAQLAGVLLLGTWALFNVVPTIALAVLLGLFWLAALPIRSELRLACARLLPRRRRRLRISDADVETTFRHIVRAEFGSSH